MTLLSQHLLILFSLNTMPSQTGAGCNQITYIFLSFLTIGLVVGILVAAIECSRKCEANKHRCPWIFFQGGGQKDPLEFRKISSGGGPGGKQGVYWIFWGRWSF